MDDRADFERQVGRIEELVGRVESLADSAARDLATELMRSVMDLHEAGLRHLLEVLEARAPDARHLIEEIGSRDPARSLLLLYGLHPQDVRTRVSQALEKTRPYLQSHGGDVELLAIDDDGTVHLRLEGSCDGCPSSSVTLKMAIEEAISRAAPDVVTIAVENRLVSLEGQAEAVSEPGEMDWKDVGSLESVPPGAARVLAIHQEPILFCRLRDTFYAYACLCPACRQEIDAWELEGPALTCSGCGQRYDAVQAGRGLDRPQIHLSPFPLLVEGGRARVALPVSEARPGGE